MRVATIMRSDSFRVDSYGNGIGYVLANDREQRSVFVQGDAAAEFRRQIEALEKAHPDWTTERVLAEIWRDYEIVADPDQPENSLGGPSP